MLISGPFGQITRIKEKVEEQSGVPPPQQRLIFGGRQMYVLRVHLNDVWNEDPLFTGPMTRQRGILTSQRARYCI